MIAETHSLRALCGLGVQVFLFCGPVLLCTTPSVLADAQPPSPDPARGVGYGAPRPRLVSPRPVHDFGVAAATATVEHVFLIANAGNAALEIKNVRACCGATYSLATNTVAPRAEIPLTVRLRLENRAGKQNKSFYIQSNDATQPLYQLRLTGTVTVPASTNVARPISAMPEEVDFGFIRNDSAITQTVAIVALSNAVFRVTKVECTSRWCRVTVMPSGGGTVTIAILQVQTVPVMPAGKNVAIITVRTDNPACARLEIPVTATVFADLVVVPRELAFQRRTEATTSTRYIAIRSRSGKPFKILKTDTPDPGIAVTCAPLDSGGYRLTLDNILPFEELNGKAVVITTDSPTMKPLHIPFRITESGESKQRP